MNIYPTPAEFDLWLSTSHKGDRFQYHLGHLMHDRAFRAYLAATGGFIVVHVKPLELIADYVVEAYKDGYVVLAQEKLADDIYRYVAIRTKKYRKPPLAVKSETDKNAAFLARVKGEPK